MSLGLWIAAWMRRRSPLTMLLPRLACRTRLLRRADHPTSICAAEFRVVPVYVELDTADAVAAGVACGSPAGRQQQQPPDRTGWVTKAAASEGQGLTPRRSRPIA